MYWCVCVCVEGEGATDYTFEAFSGNWLVYEEGITSGLLVEVVHLLSSPQYACFLSKHKLVGSQPVIICDLL